MSNIRELKKPIILFALLISAIGRPAAQPVATFPTLVFDFGVMKAFDKAAFPFENTGDKPLAFLSTETAPGIRIELPRGYIQPGRKDTVYIIYEARKTGDFVQSTEVYSNAGNDPVVLTIRGTVTEIIDCPDFEGHKDKRQSVGILVRDIETKEPIINAGIRIIRSDKKPVNGRTDRNGRYEKPLEQGYCMIEAEAKDYNSKQIKTYIEYNAGLIIIELKPLIEELTSDIPGLPVDTVTDDDINPDENKVYETTDEINPITAKEDTLMVDNGYDKELPEELYSPNNIIFLIDVSLSMKEHGKMEKLKISMKNLTVVLRQIDKISIISFAVKSTIRLTGVRGNEKDTICAVIDDFSPWGKTYGIEGLQAAYDLAARNFEPGGNNQVILATDGDFNSPDFSEKELIGLIKENAKNGILLTIIGFGDKDSPVKRMKKMAETGNGNYIHIGDETQVSDLLIDEIKANSLKSANQGKKQ